MIPRHSPPHRGLLTLAILALVSILAHADEPAIISFAADDSSVSPGTEVSLNWEVQNADQLLLDDVDVTELTSVTVAPLITTIYTLTARNADGDSTARVTVEVADAPGFIGAAGRYVEVVKSGFNNTQMHLSEIEVFEFGVTPNEALQSGLSTNGLVQDGSSSVQTPPTTTDLDQGTPQSVYNNALERGVGIWTTRNGLGTEPRYMLDLGETQSVGTVRLFGRADTCCLERLQNVTVNVYADAGDDTPGALVNSATFPGTAPAGNAGHIELDLAVLDPGISNFSTEQFLIGPNDPITLDWVVKTATTTVSIDQGVGDVTAHTEPDGSGAITIDPGPLATTVYTLTAVRPGGTSISSLLVEVTNKPQISSFTADASPVSPGTEVRLSWDVGNVTSLALNGVDVTGSEGTTVTPQSTTAYTLTASNPNGSARQELRVQVVLPGEPILSEFLADNETGLLDEDDEPSDWIELCNPTDVPASLDGYYLTDDPRDLTKWRIPAVTIAPNDYLVIFASGNDRTNVSSELHTNFSLERNGDYLALVKPDGTTIVNEFAPFPAQRQDVSYGFDSEALRQGYFLPVSPGGRNRGSFSDFVADTMFSIDRGFYVRPIEVEITSATPDAEIRYTTDGSKPTATTGRVYTAPVIVRKTTVLRAAAFKRGYVPTNVDTHTYIFTADVIEDASMSTSITRDRNYSPLMDASLRSVPSISLVFEGDVVRSEKEASIEFINFEAGNTQIEAGMERFGNYVTNFTKRGVRLNFRNEYGASKLRFPIFDGHEYDIPPSAEIDSINLRSGNHDMAQRGAYMSNRFTDDSMLEMGNIAPHGRFVHVYMNGKYWGQYHLRERWNGAMVSEYFAGGKDDYEAVNANDGFQQNMRVYDGSGRHWNRAQSLVAGPEPFTRAARHIDIPNIIDFMLLWVSGNCESEFRSAGSVPNGVPFKFFIKDADGYLRSSGHAVNHPGPLSIMSRLSAENDPDFKILLADRIHKHFFNDGALTPDRNIARLQRRVDESRLSFISESARWRERTPSTWENFQDNLISSHFPSLTRSMIGKFRSARMYPALDAPAFSQHGGAVSSDFKLRISAPDGTIYYTLDGTDPRLPASGEPGEISSTAIPYDGSISIEGTTRVRARVLDNGTWSALNEATFIPTQDFRSLVVSEIMYNPSPATAGEIAAGHDNSEDFEYLELLNTGAVPLDLTGVRFVAGIEFDFTGSNLVVLPVNGRVLIVEDPVAFAFRYGPGLPVAGQYSGKLKDEGEALEILDAFDNSIRLFTYDNQAPWPTSADGLGSSLVLVDPNSRPDHNRPASWRASGLPGGTPGGPEQLPQTYENWTAANGLADPDGDDDSDGFSNFLEFVLMEDPLVHSGGGQVQPSTVRLDLGGGPQEYLSLNVRHRLTSTEFEVTLEVSNDLAAWDQTGRTIVLHNRVYHGDGSATSTYRSTVPTSADPVAFLRIRFEGR